MTPNYPSVTTPFGGQYASPQTPATGYTPGGYGTPSQYEPTTATSNSSALTTPTVQTWDNRSSPMRGLPRHESQSVVRFNGWQQNPVRQNGVAVRGARRPLNNTVVQHNIVDVDRISQGLDVRTTVSYF